MSIFSKNWEWTLKSNSIALTSIKYTFAMNEKKYLYCMAIIKYSYAKNESEIAHQTLQMMCVCSVTKF